MKVEFIDLGWENINKVIEVKDVKALHKEIGKHIISRQWGMNTTKTPGLYEVYAGLRIIGHVKLLEH